MEMSLDGAGVSTLVRAVTGSHEEPVTVWDAEKVSGFKSGFKRVFWYKCECICKGARLCTPQGQAGHVGSVATSADGARVVTGSYMLAKLRDAETGTCLCTLQGYPPPSY
jgi:hypothetical protein